MEDWLGDDTQSTADTSSDLGGPDGSDEVSDDGAGPGDLDAADCFLASDCESDNKCLGEATCLGGRCAWPEPVVCAVEGACIVSECEPSTGLCRSYASPSTRACDDGNACTEGDRCGDAGEAGSCVGGAAIDCSSQSDCRKDGQCNPLSGVCIFEPELDGKTCNDATNKPSGGAAAGHMPVRGMPSPAGREGWQYAHLRSAG